MLPLLCTNCYFMILRMLLNYVLFEQNRSVNNTVNITNIFIVFKSRVDCYSSDYVMCISVSLDYVMLTITQCNIIGCLSKRYYIQRHIVESIIIQSHRWFFKAYRCSYNIDFSAYSAPSAVAVASRAAAAPPASAAPPPPPNAGAGSLMPDQTLNEYIRVPDKMVGLSKEYQYIIMFYEGR